VHVPNLFHWDKQLGQAQPVPVGQADWDRLCLSQWERQAACTKPVPLGLGKVKRDLSLSHGTSHTPTLEALSCPGTSSIPTMEVRWSLSQFHLSQLVPQSGSTRRVLELVHVFAQFPLQILCQQFFHQITTPPRSSRLMNHDSLIGIGHVSLLGGFWTTRTCSCCPKSATKKRDVTNSNEAVMTHVMSYAAEEAV